MIGSDIKVEFLKNDRVKRNELAISFRALFLSKNNRIFSMLFLFNKAIKIKNFPIYYREYGNNNKRLII